MYSFNVNTITNAQRAVKLLKRIGITSKIGRLKNPSKSMGCGYTVDLECDDISALSSYLESNGVKVVSVGEK